MKAWKWCGHLRRDRCRQERMGITKGTKGIALKQVLASVGQGKLMNIYERLFEQYNIPVGRLC